MKLYNIYQRILVLTELFPQESEYDLQENEIFTTAKTLLQEVSISA